MRGGVGGLIYEYTLTPLSEGTTIKDQNEGSLEKWQGQEDGTIEVGLEYANIHVSH